MAADVKTVIRRNLWKENPIIRQILGICSALAVTGFMLNSLVMGLGVMFVTAFSSLTISLLRHYIPKQTRLIIQTLIIAAYVICVDLILQAYFPAISRALGPYVGLIITNCIIMGRAEAFAQQNKPLISFLDGLAAGVGYTIIILLIALFRESLGFGTIFGVKLPFEFTNWTFMVMPPAAFFIIGIFIWVASNHTARRERKTQSQTKG